MFENLLLLLEINAVKRCSLACSQQQNTPNQNSHCFSAVFSRHHAIAVLPKVAKASLSCLLFWSRACVTSAFFVLQATSFISLHFTRFAGFHYTTFISVAFSPPAAHYSARLHCRSGCVQWALIFCRHTFHAKK